MASEDGHMIWGGIATIGHGLRCRHIAALTKVTVQKPSILISPVTIWAGDPRWTVLFSACKQKPGIEWQNKKERNTKQGIKQNDFQFFSEFGKNQNNDLTAKDYVLVKKEKYTFILNWFPVHSKVFFHRKKKKKLTKK